MCSCIFRLQCKRAQHAILTSAFPTCLLTEMFEGTITRDNWLPICKCNGTWYQTGSLQCLTATFQIFIQIYSMNIHWHTFKSFFLEFWKKGSSYLTLSPKYPPPQIPSYSYSFHGDKHWLYKACTFPICRCVQWSESNRASLEIKADISYRQHNAKLLSHWIYGVDDVVSSVDCRVEWGLYEYTATESNGLLIHPPCLWACTLDQY